MKKLAVWLSVLIPTIALAQQYSIDWYKIAGGGGTSSNGQYTLSGTIGQHDAGGPMTGGNYSLTGGFWSLLAVQTPGAPTLQIFLTATNTAVVQWPASSTYSLKQSPSLSNPSWGPPPQTVNNNGTFKYIVVSPPVGNVFYRLSNP